MLFWTISTLVFSDKSQLESSIYLCLEKLCPLINAEYVCVVRDHAQFKLAYMAGPHAKVC